MEFKTNIPLSKIKTRRTENRILDSFKNRDCVVYSKRRNKFMASKRWVESIDKAKIRPFPDHYEKTHKMNKFDIIYRIV